ncbi:serine hydrolase [Rhizohabitans arisaemae]|uniref:serine hydrolase n=1 Tax=Rhizohabitans arisaemae TaxID=2720610 RepID=UPI0024B2414E|nr:serine hydrolase [Rhizohabitans arisaemae]
MFSRLSRRMDALVGAYAELGRFSGAVLVARGDRRLFAKGYGCSDYEHGVPNTTATALRIGSQTKLFTSIAILRLQEQGRLRVTDPIGRHLPGYPRGAQITLHHLLTNTSGIPDYVTTDGFTRVMGTPRTRGQLIDDFKDRPLLFEPGARMSYSNSGWILLGEVIERLSGLTYGRFLHRNVFAPLAMEHSGLAHGIGPTAGHLSVDGRITTTPHVDNSNQDAAGALHSTVGDLHRCYRGLPRLLRPESLAELFKPHVDADGTGYGYGCAVSADRVESAGGIIGFVSVSAHYRNDDLFVTVLSNIENAAFCEIESALAAIARGEPYEPPTRRVFVTLAPDVLDRYAGRYTMRYAGRASTMDVTREGERLMVEVQGLTRTELRPMSRTRFFARMKGEVELDFRANGEVALTWAGREITARPVPGRTADVQGGRLG